MQLTGFREKMVRPERLRFEIENSFRLLLGGLGISPRPPLCVLRFLRGYLRGYLGKIAPVFIPATCLRQDLGFVVPHHHFDVG